MRMQSLLVLGLLSAGCSSSLAPVADVQGIWTADYTVPGASLVLDLTQTNDAVEGTGTYSIEAGRAGNLQIRGTYGRPSITLNLTFDYGATGTYAGTVLDSRHVRGQISYGTGQVTSLTFTRR